MPRCQLAPSAASFVVPRGLQGPPQMRRKTLAPQVDSSGLPLSLFTIDRLQVGAFGPHVLKGVSPGCMTVSTLLLLWSFSKTLGAFRSLLISPPTPHQTRHPWPQRHSWLRAPMNVAVGGRKSGWRRPSKRASPPQRLSWESK